MQRYKYLLLLPCLALLLAACAQTKESGDKPTLTVTIEPLRYFAEAIAGDRFHVVSMVPEGSNPETYDPTPQQLVRLAESKAYLQIGNIGFEQAWIGKLKSNAPDLPFHDMSEGVELIHDAEAHTHGHAHTTDPHIWNSVTNARLIARNICRTLQQTDSEGKAYYQQRLDSLMKVLDRTDRKIREHLKDAGQAFVIYHPALTYFAKEYGLKQICIEAEGKEPSPAWLQRLIRTCKENQVHTIFIQKEFDQRNAELIAGELGLKVTVINPLSYRWDEEMLHIAEALHRNSTNIAGNEQTAVD